MIAPFDEKGNLKHETGYGPDDWKETEPFFAVIHLIEMYRHGHSAYYRWRSDEGITYPMFLKDLENLLLTSSIINGLAVGTFRVVKRGRNYGIAIINEPQKKKKRNTEPVKTTVL